MEPSQMPKRWPVLARTLFFQFETMSALQTRLSTFVDNTSHVLFGVTQSR